MSKVISSLFVAAIVFSLLIAPTFAFEGNIRPPRMILRGNLSDSFTGSINVTNPNNFTVNVSTDVFGDIENITSLNTNFMILDINQSEILDFEINTSDLFNEYYGEIIFTFINAENEAQGVRLSSTIIVLLEGNVTQTNGDVTDDAGYGYIIPAAIIIILLIVIASILRIGKKI